MVIQYYENMKQSTPMQDLPLSPIIKSASPLRRQVLEELRQSIIAGRLKPGCRLVERELIAMMGVSRTVIREALRQLESEGLVEVIPNKGPIVRELTLAEARDLYSVRAVLEGLAARLFAENAKKHDVEALESELDVIAEAYEGGEHSLILEAKNRFYEILFEGAGSESLSLMIGLLHVRICRWRALGLGHPRRSSQRWKDSVERLRGLVQAVKKRDGALAEKILREEVTEAAAEVVRLLETSKAI
jgi:GntR family transcriptional regulator, trigonelline degradation regulator